MQDKELLDSFAEFYVKQFAEFYHLNLDSVREHFINSGVWNILRDGYEAYHSQSEMEIVEELSYRFKDIMGILNFEEQYRRNYIVILYHGTNSRFEEVDITVFRGSKDFGSGFYLGNSLDRAKEFAKRKVELRGTGTPVVYSYEFNTNALRRLNVKQFAEVNEEWVNTVADCRTGGQILNADLVIGPISDDQVWKYTNLYIEKKLSIEEFISQAKIYEDFVQYCFLTEKSLQWISRIQVIDME